MLSALKSHISKKIKKETHLWHFLRFFYMLFSGNYFLILRGQLRRHWQIKIMPLYGKKVLEDFLSACGPLGIRPFLLRGTLLGYYREGGLVKNDYDIDLGLLEQDFQKIEALKDALAKKGFVVYRDCCYTGPLKNIGSRFLIKFLQPLRGIWVDVDLLYQRDGLVAYIEDKRFQYLYEGKEIRDKKTLTTDVIGFALVYPEKIFAELTKVKFLGLEIWVPIEAEQYLKITYGDWQIPKSKNEAPYQNMKTLTYDTGTKRLSYHPLP